MIENHKLHIYSLISLPNMSFPYYANINKYI
jgi:hypothetical protein